MIDESNIMLATGVHMPNLAGRFNTTVQEYVEIIRDLVAIQQVARVKDIARLRQVTRSSVSTALSNLVELGLVNHEHYGYVALTETGRELGDILSLRHGVIQRFLQGFLALDPEAADREACVLEHAMSPEALNALIRFIRIVEKCPQCGSRVISSSSTQS